MLDASASCHMQRFDFDQNSIIAIMLFPVMVFNAAFKIRMISK